MKREITSISFSEYGTGRTKKFMCSHSRQKKVLSGVNVIEDWCRAVEGVVLMEFIY